MYTDHVNTCCKIWKPIDLLQFNFESLFRSLHYALMDNCCREYLFLVDFYMASGTASLDLFNAIMAKTLQTYLVCTVLIKMVFMCIYHHLIFQALLLSLSYVSEINGGACVRVLRLNCYFPVHTHSSQI